ncbi:MAG: ATP-grasp domain-containing protein [Spirochaetota bacterium]
MTVFILGAGVMQMPAITAARELGWKVVAADGNPSAPGAAECDAFHHVDLKDWSGLLAVAKALQARSGLDAVFTAGTDFSAVVAHLARELGLPGHSPEAAQAASDKLLMRACFARAGLPSPRFAEFSATMAPAASLPAGLELPLVVKPADNMGARGCCLARSLPELRNAIAAALPLSRSGRVIVEEYIEGPEFSIDALVYDGEFRIRGFADRHIHFAPYFVELGHTMPSAIDPAIREEVLRVFVSGARALGLSHGAAKGDMKWCPGRGGPFIGEIAARLSGGYMSGWTWPYASGHDLTRDALLLAAGLRPPVDFVDRGGSSAERAFMSIPGQVTGISGLRAAKASPGIKELFVRIRPGDDVVFPSNNVEKCGNLISQADNVEEARDRAEAAIRLIIVRLEAPNPATEAFLRTPAFLAGDQSAGAWPPSAFDLPPDLATLIDSLPDYLPASLPPGSKTQGLQVAALNQAASFHGRDWSGRSLDESAELACSLAGATLVTADPAKGSAPSVGGQALARPFWKALVRGGAPAGLYVLDALRAGSLTA